MSRYDFHANGIQPKHTIQFSDVPCCSHKEVSPYIIQSADDCFSFWSFEISKSILRKQKLMIGLDSFTKQILNVWPQYEFKPHYVFRLILNKKVKCLFFHKTTSTYICTFFVIICLNYQKVYIL